MSRSTRKRNNRRQEKRRVLDVKLKASHRRQARLRALALFLIFVTAVGLGGYGLWRAGDVALEEWVYQNKAFAISKVDVETDGIISRAQLESWAGVRVGENLLALSLGRVKRDLELVPSIKVASVERVLPGTLRIRVQEREPVARVQLASAAGGLRTYLLDAEGYVMLPMDPRQLTNPSGGSTAQLTSLTGLDAAGLGPGRRLENDQVLAALELVTVFRRSVMAGVVQLRELDLSEPGVLRGRTSDGVEVTFGLRGFPRQLALWREVHDHFRTSGVRVRAMDFSVSNNIPVQLQEASAPEPTRGL